MSFTLKIPGANAKQCDVVVSPFYVKVNQHPHFFDADLCAEIDINDPRTTAKLTAGQCNLHLRKKLDGKWGDFRERKLEKKEILDRRTESLKQWQIKQDERHKEREEKSFRNTKKAEEQNWAIERNEKNKVEQWKEEEKKIATDETFDVLENVGEITSASSGISFGSRKSAKKLEKMRKKQQELDEKRLETIDDIDEDEEEEEDIEGNTIFLYSDEPKNLIKMRKKQQLKMGCKKWSKTGPIIKKPC